MQAGNAKWHGVDVGVGRSGYTGEDGFELSVPAEQVEALAEALCAQDMVKPVGSGRARFAAAGGGAAAIRPRP